MNIKKILFLLFFFAPFTLFSAEVKIKKTPQGGYQLFVDGNPFFIKGVIYNPTPTGKGPEYNFLSGDEKIWEKDGELLKNMGINCLRIYSPGDDLEKTKKFIRTMYEKFGIYTIVGDWLGLWEKDLNYADRKFRTKIKMRIKKEVTALKDEKGLLLWVLGNENNYTFSGKIGFWTSKRIEKLSTPYDKILKKAEIYYSFVNELARLIKKIDRHHPVALGNGEISFLDVAKKVSKDVDLLAVISYRGKKFGSLYRSIKEIFDKPFFFSEFGADAYDAYRKKEDEEKQAEFIISQWQDIYKNSVFGGNLKGNCLGGTLFEWVDEWWKHNEGFQDDWSVHNEEAGWSNGSYYFDIRAENNLNMNEEWFGIVKIDKDNNRTPRKIYYLLKDFFSSPSSFSKSQAESVSPARGGK